MSKYYKAVRLDRTSHYDGKTLWKVGKIVRPDIVDIESKEPCGNGIHVSPTLLDAVGYQKGPSRYYEVEPLEIIGQDDTKARCTGVKVLHELSKREQDELAGFKLWEANHPVNPLSLKPRKVNPITTFIHSTLSYQSIRFPIYQTHIYLLFCCTY